MSLFPPPRLCDVNSAKARTVSWTAALKSAELTAYVLTVRSNELDTVGDSKLQAKGSSRREGQSFVQVGRLSLTPHHVGSRFESGGDPGGWGYGDTSL